MENLDLRASEFICGSTSCYRISTVPQVCTAEAGHAPEWIGLFKLGEGRCIDIARVILDPIVGRPNSK